MSVHKGNACWIVDATARSHNIGICHPVFGHNERQIPGIVPCRADEKIIEPLRVDLPIHLRFRQRAINLGVLWPGASIRGNQLAGVIVDPAPVDGGGDGGEIILPPLR